MRFRSALVLVALIATPALAHPKLVASAPTTGASVAAPAAITLTFSEKMFEKMSGATLTMTGMLGMANHPAMAVSARSALSEDGKTMIVTPTTALSPGSYKVDWYGVAGDTHRVTGAVDFKVR
jgi:copper resistance protein C